MSSWPVKSLSEVSVLITKGTTPTTLGLPFSSEGVPFLRAQNLQDGKVNIEIDPLFVPAKTHLALSRSKIIPGDILLSIAGTIGRAALVEEKFSELNCNQAVAIVRPNKQIDSKFLLHWMRSAEATSQMRRSEVTATISNLSLGEIAGFQLALPPLEEQRRIASVLDQATDLRLARQLAANNIDALGDAIFQEMFGDPFASPSHELKPLGAVATLINGRAYSKHEEKSSGTPVLRIQNLNGGHRWFYSDLSLPPDKYCEEGDLLFAWSGTFGPYIWAGPKVIYHYHIWKIAIGPKLTKPYLFSLLKRISNDVKNTGRGIAMTHATKGDMEKRLIPVPPLALQKQFGQKMAAVKFMAEANARSLFTMSGLVDALQHRAFQGEL